MTARNPLSRRRLVLTALYLLNRFVWFYRDPVRVPAESGRVLISPADGQVVYVKRFEDGAVASTHRLAPPFWDE